MWSGDFVDLQQFADGGNTLYIHLANSELGGGRKISIFVIIAIVVVGTFFLSVSIWLLWRFRAKLKAFLNPSQKNNELLMLYARRSEELSTDLSGPEDLRVEGQHVSGAELSFLDFNTVALATNNFLNENKIGQGGFGPVHKGKLPWEQEIAVKRLSRKSGQGLEDGYMAPEYAMEGLFSVKSDVYSFGVLILEIITGRRNASFRLPKHSNIIGYAWDLWDGDKAMEMIDPKIADSCCQNEVLRCIQVGMLCVQDMAFDRPTMSSVLLMLEGQSTSMQMPRRPSFTSMRRSPIDMDEYWKES
ncbi:G-type lectin S-receptor-like serine/threonine-protein kinase B120 [Cornus florida]|uniref:G-type lectin S-receptor-like serine/threonine-protein kinase B120 n=1 Tax=Cornus florida TaxID=4283 RepID=UPI00289CEF64|nr:G-type lectin S-receptor-like serine/threonine-protein kinase B120 [Cornus florida]